MNELNWYYTALTLLATGLMFYLASAFRPAVRFFREGGWGSLLLATLCLVVSLVLRSQQAQYFALSNMYESLLTLSIGIQIAFLALDRWFKPRMLGFPVTLLLLAALIYDRTLPTDIHPLQPALQSYWRSIHVPIILLSYALFTLAFLSSAVFLIKDFLERRSRDQACDPASDLPGGGLRPAVSGVGELTFHPDMAIETRVNIYDEITYRCVAFGFPLLTLGIILGGMWANEAWGNYWSWDPKESMSLVTLLGYGVYLHLRVNGAHWPRVLCAVSVIGFILMLVTYFGVNLMGVGLHSYGRIG